MLMKACRGVLIAFEGIDGSGKSTAASQIGEKLRELGYKVAIVSSQTIPEDSVTSQIRNITKNYSSMNELTETFLYLASLSERTHGIVLPSLKEGQVVIADRYSLSVLVLARYGRQISQEIVEQMINLATDNCKPNFTFIFDVPPEVALCRIHARSFQSRKEREGIDLLSKLRKGYRCEGEALCQDGKGFIIDSNSLGVEEMVLRVLEKILEILKNSEAKT
ncbi:MAG: dTMP kinase [Candidatus Caldarchaeum sp.]